MTNGEKYLKEGVSVEELAKDITKFIADGYPDSFIFPKSIENYFKAETKPTLTEDERVILRNIEEYIDTIRRNSFGQLILHYAQTDNECGLHYLKPHLFQFIKERRRIFNRRTIKGGRIMEDRILLHIFVTLVYFIAWYMGYRFGKKWGDDK